MTVTPIELDHPSYIIWAWKLGIAFGDSLGSGLGLNSMRPSIYKHAVGMYIRKLMPVYAMSLLVENKDDNFP